MKTKNVLLSSLMVLGFLTASCNKQNVAPKNFNEKLKGGSARYLEVGNPIFGSGNLYEVPYFFTNSNGVFYPTATKPITGLQLTIPEAGGNTYSIYYSTDPKFFDINGKIKTWRVDAG
jgi:hypothetical protein